MDAESTEEAVGGGISAAFDPLEFREVVALLLRPRGLAKEAPRLAAELAKVALGLSEIDVPAKDPQYRDRAWREHGLFRRLAQGHLALTGAVERLTDDESADWRARERARYLRDIVTGGISPANSLLTNPAAWRRTIETGGMSVLRGTRNMARDALTNRRMPSMVDQRPFTVGGNLACSDGEVVHREEMFEVLQYRPATATVHERPLLFVPPELNRYYVLDLAPGRSMVEYAVAHGIQTFMVVWRNPRKDPELRHGFWSLEDYLEAHVRAFDVVQEITGCEDINLIGLCSGGMTSALVQAHLAARGRRPVHSATYLVTMLDARQPNMVTMMAAPGVSTQMDKRAAKGDVIDAKAVAQNFAWMRPKDLVYSYVVNNWLLGNDPPAFDVLSWNSDATNMSATFSRDSNALLAAGRLVEPGGVTLLDTPIDLSSVKCDNFVVAGLRDHITTWRPCYMTSRLLGGDTEVVVVNSGHIQSFVNPVETSRYMYWHGSGDSPDPDRWIEGAERRDGSWWPHWMEWLTARSGDEGPAPESLGSATHPPVGPAPGAYVHEK